MIQGIWKWEIMKKIYAKSIILFFLIFSSCLGDDLLKNTREDYMGDNLRIGGFYYEYYQGKITSVVFLYRNGIYFLVNGDGKERTSPDEVTTLLTEDHIKFCKTDKFNWGVFIIKGNDILIETWSPTGAGWRATATESGTILNDTSFIITKRRWSQTEKDMYDEYFFYPYSPKPDSTNNYIK
jgi:hypothetical protein